MQNPRIPAILELLKLLHDRGPPENANRLFHAMDIVKHAGIVRPIDMVLHCTACGHQHIDTPTASDPGWTNPPHKSHLCSECGHIWRPADVTTNGVQALKTKGKNDSCFPVLKENNVWPHRCSQNDAFGSTCENNSLCKRASTSSKD